jgi:hypothetical protein
LSEQPTPQEPAAPPGPEADPLATPATPQPTGVFERHPDEPAGLWTEAEPLPVRPRRRLLTPLPVALLCVLLTACGFIGGVLVEKGQGSSGGEGAGSGGLASRLAGLRAGAGSASSRTGASGASAASAGSGLAGAFGAGRGAGATIGEVTFVHGDELYVGTPEGDTVKVLAPAGTAVTKTVSSTTRSIHPGETVIVTGSTAPSGAVTAETIRVAGAGGGGLGALLRGSTTRENAAGGGSETGAKGAGAGGGPALFGPG